MFLSKMAEADRKARALLVDLIALVDDPAVAKDEEFVKLLEDAFSHARRKVAIARADQACLEERPKEVAHP